MRSIKQGIYHAQHLDRTREKKRLCLLFSLTVALFACSEGPPERVVYVNGTIATPDSGDLRYINLAIDAWTKKQRATSSDEALAGYEIAIDYKAEEVCVRFLVMPPTLGGEPMYCYLPDTEQVTRILDEVE